MIVAIHQPAHLPWLGYLDRIARVDRFVFLDHVQFEKNSFTNRNRIKTAAGVGWLTVPVRQRGHTTSTIADMTIDETRPWRAKQIRTIEEAYRRTPGFAAAFPAISTWIADPTSIFADYCLSQLKGWLACTGIATPVVRSSELGIGGRKSDLVLDICEKLGADRYLSGPLGRGYLDEAAFAEAGVGIDWHTFTAPVYPQRFGDFVPNLSAVDHWMNTGDLAGLFSGRARYDVR